MKTLKQREKMKNTRKSTLAEIDGLWKNITSGLHQDYVGIRGLRRANARRVGAHQRPAVRLQHLVNLVWLL